MPKFEIEITEKDLAQLHNLQKIDKELREQYDEARIDIESPRLEKITARINQTVQDIHQILLNSIYKNEDWQAKE